MTPLEFRGVLGKLKLSQSECARFVGANDRTVRRWLAGELDVPRCVEVLLLLMLSLELGADDVRARLESVRASPTNPKP